MLPQRQTTSGQQETTLNLHFTLYNNHAHSVLVFFFNSKISFKFSSNVMFNYAKVPHFVIYFRRETRYVQGVVSKQACQDISGVRYVLDVIVCINPIPVGWVSN